MCWHSILHAIKSHSFVQMSLVMKWNAHIAIYQDCSNVPMKHVSKKLNCLYVFLFKDESWDENKRVDFVSIWDPRKWVAVWPLQKVALMLNHGNGSTLTKSKGRQLALVGGRPSAVVCRSGDPLQEMQVDLLNRDLSTSVRTRENGRVEYSLSVVCLEWCILKPSAWPICSLNLRFT